MCSHQHVNTVVESSEGGDGLEGICWHSARDSIPIVDSLSCSNVCGGFWQLNLHFISPFDDFGRSSG